DRCPCWLRARFGCGDLRRDALESLERREGPAALVVGERLLAGRLAQLTLELVHGVREAPQGGLARLATFDVGGDLLADVAPQECLPLLGTGTVHRMPSPLGATPRGGLKGSPRRLFFSPGGAAVNCQGREPLGNGASLPVPSPGGAVVQGRGGPTAA